MLQDHLQETYQFLFDGAHEALLHGPSFVPFGAGVRKTGERIHSVVDLHWSTSTPQDHISGLIAGFRLDEEKTGLIAIGLVFDTAASEERLNERALCFHLEAANGRAVQVLVPYARQPDDRIYFGEPELSEVPCEVFATGTPQ